MLLKKIKEFIPLGIVSFFSTVSIFISIWEGYVYDYRQIIALLLLGISILFFLSGSHFYKYVFAVVLLIASFTPISFTAYVFNFSIGAFLIFLIHAFIFRKSLFDSLFSTFIKDEEEVINRKNKKVEFFKRNFSTLEIEEINKKLEEDLVSEAKIALEELKYRKLNRET